VSALSISLTLLYFCLRDAVKNSVHTKKVTGLEKLGHELEWLFHHEHPFLSVSVMYLYQQCIESNGHCKHLYL
jgi:hypothetical protein